MHSSVSLCTTVLYHKKHFMICVHDSWCQASIPTYQSLVIHLSHVHSCSHCCPPFNSLSFLNWQIFAAPVLLLPIRLPFSLKHVASVAECEVSYMQLQHTLVQHTPQDRLHKWICHKVVCSCWCILHLSWFSCSHLTLLEVQLSIYAINRRVLACAIELKLWIPQTSISAWINFATRLCWYACEAHIWNWKGWAGPRTTLKSVSENVNTIQASPTREDGFTAASSACQGGFSLSPYKIVLLTHYPNSIGTWIEPGTIIVIDCW
jgi:hypothetical protein